MSALENPELEKQLEWMNVLNELYSRWAFNENTAIEIERYPEKVAWVLFWIDNWLISKKENPWQECATGRNMDSRVRVRRWGDFIYHLTTTWRSIVEDTVKIVDSITSLDLW